MSLSLIKPLRHSSASWANLGEEKKNPKKKEDDFGSKV
jgi:hypothetical protein